jgi:hypothetical protein
MLVGFARRRTRHLRRSGRGGLVYDDTKCFSYLSDLFFIIIGSIVILGLLGLSVLLFPFVVGLLMASGELFISLGVCGSIVVFGVTILAMIAYELFFVYLFLFALRTKPIQIYEMGIEIGWRKWPRFYEFSKIKKIQINTDKKEDVKEIVLFFRNGTTYAVSERTNADYVSKDLLPFLGVLLKQIAVYQTKRAYKPRSKIEFKRIESLV